MIEHSLHLAIDHLAVRKRHLHIELRKLRLPIGTQIFITKASCDLVITVERRDHSDLLQYLRRLRQSEKLSGMYARRNNKIPRAFRRRFQKDRCFDLDKTTVVEILTDLRDGLGTHPDVVLQLGTAQIEIPKFQTRRFVRQIFRARNFKLKRRHFRFVKKQNLGNLDLDIACRELCVVRAFCPGDNFSLDRDNKFAAKRLCFSMVGLYKEASLLAIT